MRDIHVWNIHRIQVQVGVRRCMEQGMHIKNRISHGMVDDFVLAGMLHNVLECLAIGGRENTLLAIVSKEVGSNE